jgi:hypothetical protein
LEALLDLRLDARWKTAKVSIGGRTIRIPVDGLLTTQVKLAKRWRWDRKTVNRFLLSLTRSKIILIETVRGVDNGYTVITFLNSNGFEPDEIDEIPIDGAEKSRFEYPSSTHELRMERRESVGRFSLYADQGGDIAGESVKGLTELEEAALSGDYWALVNPKRANAVPEAKLLMQLGSEALLRVARVKFAFGKEATVVERRISWSSQRTPVLDPRAATLRPSE